jgi:hypothetical protein
MAVEADEELADEAAEEAAALETAEDAVLDCADEATLEAEEEFVVGGVTVPLPLLLSPSPPQAISSRLVASAVSPPFIAEFPAIIVILLHMCLLSVTKVFDAKKPTLFASICDLHEYIRHGILYA